MGIWKLSGWFCHNRSQLTLRVSSLTQPRWQNWLPSLELVTWPKTREFIYKQKIAKPWPRTFRCFWKIEVENPVLKGIILLGLSPHLPEFLPPEGHTLIDWKHESQESTNDRLSFLFKRKSLWMRSKDLKSFKRDAFHSGKRKKMPMSFWKRKSLKFQHLCLGMQGGKKKSEWREGNK